MKWHKVPLQGFAASKRAPPGKSKCAEYGSLPPSRVQHPKQGIGTTRPGTLLRNAVPTRGGPPDTTRPGSVEADTVAHCDDSPEGD